MATHELGEDDSIHLLSLQAGRRMDLDFLREGSMLGPISEDDA